MSDLGMKRMACLFLEWAHQNAKAFPDGWHYKGEAMTTSALYEIFIKDTQ